MKIFLSWSGDDSRKAAEAIKTWLGDIFQDANVFVSSQDIKSGQRWAVEIGDNLADDCFGILILTPRNLNAPWILFEAGALSKQVKSPVLPILFGEARLIDLGASPLSQFQAIEFNEQNLSKAARDFNSQRAVPADAQRLERVIVKFWPDLNEKIAEISFAVVSPKKSETDRLSKMEEILVGYRNILRKIEDQVDFMALNQGRPMGSGTLTGVAGIRVGGVAGLPGSPPLSSVRASDSIAEVMPHPKGSSGSKPRIE